MVRFMSEHSNFYGLGIAPGILEVIAKLNFKIPTPIQEQSIPVAIEGKDLMGIAQTGTGKTLAFGIPLIQRVLRGVGLGLVVAPTRELALQIDETLRKVGTPLNLRTAVLIGGESISRQIRDLHRSPQIIIGTPGRILDHLGQRTVSFQKVSVLILDEADRMLDMGFAPQLKRIISTLPVSRQTMIFSATMPEEIITIARSYLKLPIRVEIARSGTTVKDVTQELFFVPQEEKPRLLEKMLQEYRGSVLIFSRTKHSARKITTFVRALGHKAAEIHGNRSLNQRKESLEGFKTGRYRVLVATDIAARGIDVSNIELVLNYDLPENAEDYVHRIGRTARAGVSGHAVSFARPNQTADVRAIERLIRKVLPVSKIPTLPPPTPFKTGLGAERPRRSFSAYRGRNQKGPGKFGRSRSGFRRY
ncbi:MAG: DEAD/DEAH box helicase domain protein [Candidatus Jorgensenbacteria bacterium GW2011_GWA1_48_11]|uniref:DEAD/DEAH box helicase domain protein n=1 Tax=Candidatus Jorgensenbacteria bacterium GW2011_GWA1_48_11 TaxID=1618660 RepID=A0A0G1X9A4_9BACT|nr:MAG: DEAD/DEAH box helicase domain protein [Candidatus Jorgensenbacteria bacterium GW2011_GWA1_48_11]KKW12334.1 MAG: DEAD/DEAH box helicase domain protein [Candidatus Jorgensenbacteria bacterium GW2011_GWB1_49_9]